MKRIDGLGEPYRFGGKRHLGDVALDAVVATPAQVRDVGGVDVDAKPPFAAELAHRKVDRPALGGADVEIVVLGEERFRWFGHGHIVSVSECAKNAPMACRVLWLQTLRAKSQRSTTS
ncbi:MAG: hypothetical protein OXH09_08175 [Gammaproteobacteria bacterium]|nr:hypothetical protein [Gammaproteobacteria bacterium]